MERIFSCEYSGCDQQALPKTVKAADAKSAHLVYLNWRVDQGQAVGVGVIRVQELIDDGYNGVLFVCPDSLHIFLTDQI